MSIHEFCRFSEPYSENRRMQEDQEILESNLKKLWNMRVTVILTVVEGLETVLKGLEKNLGERKNQRQIETNQISTLLRSARILGTCGGLLSLSLH